MGGVGLTRTTQDLVVRDVGAAGRVIDLLREGNESQRVGLARGLGQAASQCQQFLPQAAIDIRRRVDELGDIRLASAFSAGFSIMRLSPDRLIVQAQTPAPRSTGRCYSNGTPPASPEAQQSAAANPEGLLARNPMGGGGLSSEVRALAISDPALLASISRIIASASSAQKAAISAGLGQAANACEVVAPTVSQSIQQFVVTLGDSEVERTFASITGDRAVGAVGGAIVIGSPAGGGGGGPLGNVATVTAGSNGFGASSASGAGNNRFSFSVGVTTTATTRSQAGQTTVLRFSVSP
jgi:hypothetical protein